MAFEIFSVTYYQTFKDVYCPLRLERREEWKVNVKETEKNCVLSKKTLKFVMLNCWNHSITTRNYAVAYYKTIHKVFWHLGLNELKKWQKFSTVGVSSTSKNRPSHHKYKSPKQFELKQSWNALRALNARWAVPVYPVFEQEKSKASDEKSVKRKIA